VCALPRPVSILMPMARGCVGGRVNGMSGRYRGHIEAPRLSRPDVTRIGIDHGEEHADALSMLLHRPIQCPARRESVALVGPAQPVVGGAAVSSFADGEPFAVDVEGEQHRPGPSRGFAVHIGNGAGIVAATAGAPVHDSQYPRAGTAQAAPAARVDRPAACPDGLLLARVVFVGNAERIEDAVSHRQILLSAAVRQSQRDAARCAAAGSPRRPRTARASGRAASRRAADSTSARPGRCHRCG
jgi:hypothetical protein